MGPFALLAFWNCLDGESVCPLRSSSCPGIAGQPPWRSGVGKRSLVWCSWLRTCSWLRDGHWCTYPHTCNEGSACRSHWDGHRDTPCPYIWGTFCTWFLRGPSFWSFPSPTLMVLAAVGPEEQTWTWFCLGSIHRWVSPPGQFAPVLERPPFSRVTFRNPGIFLGDPSRWTQPALWPYRPTRPRRPLLGPSPVSPWNIGIPWRWESWCTRRDRSGPTAWRCPRASSWLSSRGLGSVLGPIRNRCVLFDSFIFLIKFGKLRL